MRTMKRWLWLVGLLLIVVLPTAAPLAAQEDNPPVEETEVAAPLPEALTLETIPDRVQLQGVEMVYQGVNRCSAAALTIQLTYWVDNADYNETIRWLNPNNDDMSVRLDEMVDFANQYGLEGFEGVGGTLDMLRLLVGNGFPVLIENVYYDGGDAYRDWMSHNRVITGYDDNLQVLYSFDPLLGNGEDKQGRPIEYAVIDERWKALSRGFLVLYSPEQEPLVQEILGDYWDPTSNAELFLAQAEADLAGELPDSYDLFNKGTALTMLGRYEEAAETYDRAFGLGLPWRMMWYQFGPLEAYLGVGRYDDVFRITRDVIAATPGVEEMYYYIARAYVGTGETDRAIANLEAALWRNAHFHVARDLLAELERA